MGGHGHGSPIKIPNPDIYKVEDAPKLKLVQEELAKLGLKDPWLRNEVWHYTGLPGKSHFVRVVRAVTTGMMVGFVAFLATIGIENYFGITYGKTSHGKHRKHGGQH